MRLGVAPTHAVAIVNWSNTFALIIVFGASSGFTSRGVFGWGAPKAGSEEGYVYGSVSILFYSLCQILIFTAFGTASDASKVSFLLNIEPIVSILLGIIIFSERFAWYQWIGLLTMVTMLSASSISYSNPDKDEAVGINDTDDSAMGVDLFSEAGNQTPYKSSTTDV